MGEGERQITMNVVFDAKGEQHTKKSRKERVIERDMLLLISPTVQGVRHLESTEKK